MSVNQLILFARLDEFDLRLKWNAKAENEFDPIYVVLLDGKVSSNILNEGTVFGEDVALHEDIAQTVKGLSAARLWWSLSLVVFDASRAVDASIALYCQI